MPDAYADLQTHLARAPRRWLVTGAAGFINSNLVEALLSMGQNLRSVDERHRSGYVPTHMYASLMGTVMWYSMNVVATVLGFWLRN